MTDKSPLTILSQMWRDVKCLPNKILVWLINGTTPTTKIKRFINEYISENK